MKRRRTPQLNLVRKKEDVPLTEIRKVSTASEDTDQPDYSSPQSASPLPTPVSQETPHLEGQLKVMREKIAMLESDLYDAKMELACQAAEDSHQRKASGEAEKQLKLIESLKQRLEFVETNKPRMPKIKVPEASTDIPAPDPKLVNLLEATFQEILLLMRFDATSQGQGDEAEYGEDAVVTRGR